jgi:glucosamine--fructose-6-phosphate aminotransferase (isomerizing)
MCGIVGYIGKDQAVGVVLDGLLALEYRGYDSAGLAVVSGNSSELVKRVGRVQSLIDEVKAVDISGNLAIGHTRWATHGVPSLANAHPHSNSDQTIFVVHNGIIENYAELKAKLTSEGYKFVSETDTEVIPHLIDYYLKSANNFEQALYAALRDLSGAYAIAVITTLEPNKLYAARVSSPLVIGVGEQEYILASDPTALMKLTKKVVFLEDYDVATISAQGCEVHNLKHGRPAELKTEILDYDNQKISLGNYPNFMLKEIYEAPATIKTAVAGRALAEAGIVKLGGLEAVEQQLKYIDRLVIVACGTSYYASLVGEYLIEELAGIPVEVQLASEFKYRDEPFSRATALLAISQSGETADTIAALKKVEDYGVLRLGVVNAVGSTITRLTDAGVYCHAGPEQAVASTKAFIAQVTVLSLIALHLSKGNTKHFKPVLSELEALPAKAQAVLDRAEQIKDLADKYSSYKEFMYIGRHFSYPSALEGALKLKETSYIHAEGYAAGEMKHGPLAMIDENFPTVAIATEPILLEKTYSNIEEIKARGGPILIVANDGNDHIKSLSSDVIYLPETLPETQPILHAIALQLFAYYVAIKKGLDVDRPRNLAKSVTVE